MNWIVSRKNTQPKAKGGDDEVLKALDYWLLTDKTFTQEHDVINV